MKRNFFLSLLLALLLLGLPLRAEIPCVWTGVERIVAVGDLHGDYDHFLAILQGTKIIDADGHWAAGPTHLVQMGDIMDRGPQARRIIDLLMNLEKEAEAAGGRVHCLMGNHEELNLVGIAFDYADYVTVEQFRDFLPDSYRQKREAEFLKLWRARHRSDLSQTNPSAGDLRAFWEEVLESEAAARQRYVEHFRSRFGPWILQHNAVIKVNDTVFVHGGISSKYSLIPLADINDRIRAELRQVMAGREFTPTYLFARDGPLWFRGLAEQAEAGFQDDLDRILANLQAQHIVIGHSPLGVPSTKAMERLGGKLWVIDTGISAYFGGFLSALTINGGNFQAWGVNYGQD
jgi:hypothetical protein